MALVCHFVITTELSFHNAIHAASTLLGAQLAQIVRLTARAIATTTAASRTSMLTRSEVATFDRAFRSETAFAFKVKFFAFAPAQFTNRTKIFGHRLLSSKSNYTRRFFGGRQPLCGTGVISEIERTLSPIACTARIAFSRPGPGPLTNRSTSWIPNCWAALIACSAARRAANGVLLREPLKPAEPALPHATVFPSVSVIVTIVLLKEAKICTCPEDKERLVFFAPAVRRVERTL